MNKFIRRDNSLKQIPELLVTHATGFRESPEYRKLRDYERDIPGVVCSAFAEYICKIHEENVVGQDNSVRNSVYSAHEALEMLASSQEAIIRELVADEIYENLDCKGEVLDSLVALLGPHSLALYRRWKVHDS
jgi:hypothetical protein